MCIPGTMGIAPIETPADPVEGFTNLQPMMFHYGHTSPSPNVKLFNFAVNQLAQVYEKKCQMNDKCEFYMHFCVEAIIPLIYTYIPDRVGGCIINTCGWVDGQGYRTLVKVCEAFKGELYCQCKNDCKNVCFNL